MVKINFIISDILVSKSSMDGYGLDIFLKDGPQLKTKFHDQNLFHAAKEAKGNLFRLKYLFSEQIQNLNNNPQYYYSLTNCELFDISFGHILEDPNDDIYAESMDLIRSCADEKDIEFDGYFKQRWKDSADTIVSFDEEYFDDPDRTELYVFLSAMVDEEIFSFLNQVYFFYEHRDLTKEIVQDKIEYLTKIKGVRF
ncbi:hypothetical protein FNJ88_14190 (plasmid) [Chryseobacterium sp. SNU WT5]|uniref:hypothetical protein n=1 Tax=Chryseobacterium sp. SNU WT5 TaxID=2594269 RepID=UPI00117E37F5|nr:hypothetical protein [Chryseobacterium sp. SNU WT5]QDP86751.1 hypothetical protein FNJ88_14190 [Chryseobacterium sp. SNU WT5]